MSRRKSTAKAKLKATSQQERIHLWKQHFENLLGKPSKVMHEPITKIFSNQLNIKLGQFMQEELDSVQRKIKNRKAAGLDEILPEVWKTRDCDYILLRHCNAIHNQNTIDRWTKGCILPFPKGDLGITKNYHSSRDLQCSINSIEPKLRKYLGRTIMAFGEIDPPHYKFWLSNSKRSTCKKPWGNNICWLLQGF